MFVIVMNRKREMWIKLFYLSPPQNIIYIVRHLIILRHSNACHGHNFQHFWNVGNNLLFHNIQIIQYCQNSFRCRTCLAYASRPHPDSWVTVPTEPHHQRWDGMSICLLFISNCYSYCPFYVMTVQKMHLLIISFNYCSI